MFVDWLVCLLVGLIVGGSFCCFGRFVAFVGLLVCRWVFADRSDCHSNFLLARMYWSVFLFICWTVGVLVCLFVHLSVSSSVGPFVKWAKVDFSP